MKNYSKSFTIFICMVSAMGGLLFGYDWVVIGGAKPFYESFFDIASDPVQQGVAMTTALLGCLVGAMVAGNAADRYGRNRIHCLYMLALGHYGMGNKEKSERYLAEANKLNPNHLGLFAFRSFIKM